MHIVLIDDSRPFDGLTPLSQPLGGAEKAFASLPAALARLGHQVSVFNRCGLDLEIEGARWRSWNGVGRLDLPAGADLAIAFRRPELLDAVAEAGRRVLWVTAAPGYLEDAATADHLEAADVTLAFCGITQRALYRGRRPVVVIPPGLRAPFADPGPRFATEPPVAIVTTHPAHGLDMVLDAWEDTIRPQCPAARLHVFSQLLSRTSGDLPEALAALQDRAAVLEDQGVRVLAPGGDEAMALAYRGARLHLYPGQRDDMVCWTLAESQACGVPAVAMARGAVHERVVDGQSGYVVPDAEAFANVAVQVLNDDGVFANLSAEAARAHGRRTWDVAALEFAALASATATATATAGKVARP